jgi:hypothetical protein
MITEKAGGDVFGVWSSDHHTGVTPSVGKDLIYGLYADGKTATCSPSVSVKIK